MRGLRALKFEIKKPAKKIKKGGERKWKKQKQK